MLELLRVSLGEPPLLRRTPEWFAWKHFQNPFGPSLILVAESDGEIVGLRAFMRWELLTPGGAPLRCVRAVDTATHPDHQRKGIFRRLTLAALDLAEEEGVELIFNTPNRHSGAGYLAMGWVQVGDIGVMVRPHPLRVLSRPSADHLPDPAGFVDARPFGPAPEPEVEDRAPRGLRTPRSSDYVCWRFGAHPTARYLRVDLPGAGSAILRPNHRGRWRELVVSDLLGPRPGALARAAVRRSRAGYLVAWFSRGSPERRAALRAGLLPVPGVRALTLVARPLRPLSVDTSELASWDLALSDLELL